MDFSWSAEQDEIYERALAFARERLPVASSDAGLTRERWRALGEFGVLGLPVAAEYGGLGLDALTTARVAEAIGRGCSDTGLMFSAYAHLFACVMPIFDHGDPALRERFLPRLCSGEWIGANAITEAEAGSDVYALKTRAVRDGDHYVLNGAKSYVSNGPLADVFLVYAVTNPSHGYLGLTAFLVPAETPGVTRGRAFEKMGLESSPIGPVYFEECRIPASQRVGAEGRGSLIFKSSMGWERACLFAGYVGVMERALELTLDYARTREQFGKPIGKNQAVAHRIVDMKLRLESARLLLYRACWEMGRSRDATLSIALAKLAISEAAVQSALDAIRVHGGMGYMSETGVERLLRDAIPATIFSGTSDMQRELIAKGLGL